MLFIGWWMLKMSFAMTKKKCRALWNRSKRWLKPRRGALKLWTMQMPNWCPLFISFEVSRRPITILCWDHCDQPSSRLMWQSSKRAPAENFCGFKKLCSIMVAPMWLLVMCIGAFVTRCEYYDYYYYYVLNKWHIRQRVCWIAVVTYSAHCLQDYSIPVNAVYCNIPVNMMKMMNLAVMRSEKGCVFWCI